MYLCLRRYKAAGDSKLLKSLGKSQNIHVDIVNLLEAGKGAVQGQVSSSKIRSALNCGHMQQVAESLGRPYRLISEVVPGAMCQQPSESQTSFRLTCACAALPPKRAEKMSCLYSCSAFAV